MKWIFCLTFVQFFLLKFDLHLKLSSTFTIHAEKKKNFEQEESESICMSNVTLKTYRLFPSPSFFLTSCIWAKRLLRLLLADSIQHYISQILLLLRLHLVLNACRKFMASLNDGNGGMQALCMHFALSIPSERAVHRE